MLKNILPLMAFALLSGVAFAQTPAVSEEAALAAESEARAAETAKDVPTPALIAQKVDEAVALLKSEGKAAFPKFSGKASPFIFSGTYIWVHDEDGVMMVHPIKPKMVGKSLLGLSDPKGKLFFVEMNALVKKQGSGWVDYWWPKPGEKEAAYKVSYVKGVTVDGKLLVVGCGVYDFTEAQVAELKK